MAPSRCRRAPAPWADGWGSWANAASSTAIWSAACAGVARAQLRGQRLPGPPGAVIDERQHRMKPEPPLEVRGAPSFSECAPIKVASRSTTTCPSPTGLALPPHLPPGPARTARIAARPPRRRQGVDQPAIVGSEATAPNTSGWARTTATSARQSPPNAIATARSSTVLPGSWTERVARHGAPPTTPCQPADLRRLHQHAAPGSTPTTRARFDPNTERVRFTYGVPFRSQNLTLRQANFPKQDRHFRALLTPVTPHIHERSRLSEHRDAVAGAVGLDRADVFEEHLGFTA